MSNSTNLSIQKWKQIAKKLKTQAIALYFAYQHPQTPWYAKVFAGLVVAYTFSPIDLIPDFIPVLGYLDDLLLVPLGITLALKMIPPDVITECRQKAELATKENKPVNWIAGAVIILIWVVMIILMVIWGRKWLSR